MKLRLLSILAAAGGIWATSSLVSAADAPTAATPPPTDVVQFKHGKVDQLLAGKGGLLIGNSLYKVQVAHRVAPGVVEMHRSDTDVFYILEGTATFVTGGAAVDPQEVSPGEIRANSITGGTERHLAKGDVIVIPAGVPHQFTVINNSFLYFVVKVTH